MGYNPDLAESQATTDKQLYEEQKETLGADHTAGKKLMKKAKPS